MGIGTLRFILSLLVIDAHYGLVVPYAQRAAIDAFGISRVAYVGPGGIAVSGFFVISGYLIALVLDRKYDSGWRGASAFYVSRALRIYPLYWLAFAAYWAALVALHAPPSLDAGAIAGNLSLVPYGVLGLAADRNESVVRNLTATMLIGPSWTLCYDLVFYLVAPWLFTRKHTTWWVVVLGLVYFGLWIAFSDPRPPVWYQFFYETGVPYLFMFACGALAWHYRGRVRLPPSAAGAALACLAWITYFPVGLTNTFANQLLAGVLFTVLVAAIGQRRHTARSDRVLGDLTYATYLLHLPLLIIIQRLGWPAPAAFALAGTYLGAVALLVAFELPLDRLRDRLYQQAKQRSGSLPPVAGRAVAVAITGGLSIAAAFSVWSNLRNAGERVELATLSCPASWRCASSTVEFKGDGEVQWRPELRSARRIVADVILGPGEGDAWAGLSTANGSFAVGIARASGRCRFELTTSGRTVTDLPGWSDECRPHRFVVDTTAIPTRVAVDSLWVMDAGNEVPYLRATARSLGGATGTAGFRDIFLTRR